MDELHRPQLSAGLAAIFTRLFAPRLRNIIPIAKPEHPNTFWARRGNGGLKNGGKTWTAKHKRIHGDKYATR